jgi:hypothetical protein
MGKAPTLNRVASLPAKSHAIWRRLMTNTMILHRVFAVALVCTALLSGMRSPVQAGTVYWSGLTSTAWTNSSNWSGSVPPSAGDTIILNQGSPYTPVVSSTGNPTAGQIYLGITGGLNIFSGGSLSMTDFVTGNWGNSSGTIVTGGQMNMSGYLNLGAGGYDGKIDISGGVVQSAALSINSSGGAGMNISGSGKYITDISQLGNVNYWVSNNIIKANNGAPGWSVVVDTTTDPTKVMLTVVPEPSVTALAAVGMTVLAVRRLRRR